VIYNNLEAAEREGEEEEEPVQVRGR